MGQTHKDLSADRVYPKKLMLDHQVPYDLMAMIGGISWYLSFSDRARFNLNNIMVIP